MASSSAAIGRKGQESETFSFRVSLAIPECQLYAWFEQAAPGERVVYCQGYVPLREDAAWKLAGAWAREGLVHLLSEKHGAQTRWIAERRPIGCVGAPSAVAGKRAAAEDIVQAQLRALLGLLRDAAAKGARCPSLTVLAREVTGQNSLKARNRVVYLRKRLAGEGRIAVIPGAPNRAPVVTILARGKGCGMSTADDLNSKGEK